MGNLIESIFAEIDGLQVWKSVLGDKMSEMIFCEFKFGEIQLDYIRKIIF